MKQTKKLGVRKIGAIVAVAASWMAVSPGARADYAVLKSGARLHITGYEQVGDHIVLTVQGGSVEISADDLVTVEPEDRFAPLAAKTDPNAPFGELIHAAAQKHGVDEHLITHVIAVESNFNPKAVSRKQAQGLMQLLPQTAAKYSVANVFDPAQNIDAGTRYLKDLLEKYSGDVKLALAAYNAGPDMVTRYRGIPPFPETQKYVRAITDKLTQDKVAPTLAAITLKN
jgi:hypothetical protein